MKQTFLAGLIFVLIAAFTGTVTHAGWGSHGGDPIAIDAVAWPDQEGLARAVEAAEAAIHRSKYSEAFKNRTILELRTLSAERRYMLVENLVVVGTPGSDSDALPHDVTRFISMGGMTQLKIGANIYFSKRVLDYETPEFARLILHEVFHHVLSEFINDDEAFIVKLSDAIVNGIFDPLLEVGIELGIHLNSKFVSFRMPFLVLKKTIDAHPEKGSPTAAEALATIPASDDVAGYDIETIAYNVALKTTRQIGLCDYVSYATGEPCLATVASHVQELAGYAKQLNPSNPWIDQKYLKGRHYLCKVKRSFLGRNCPKDQLITMGDWFAVQ